MACRLVLNLRRYSLDKSGSSRGTFGDGHWADQPRGMQTRSNSNNYHPRSAPIITVERWARSEYESNIDLGDIEMKITQFGHTDVLEGTSGVRWLDQEEGLYGSSKQSTWHCYDSFFSYLFPLFRIVCIFFLPFLFICCDRLCKEGSRSWTEIVRWCLLLHDFRARSKRTPLTHDEFKIYNLKDEIITLRKGTNNQEGVYIGWGDTRNCPEKVRWEEGKSRPPTHAHPRRWTFLNCNSIF